MSGLWEREMYGAAESGAMRRILGMFSKVLGSAGLDVGFSLSAWRRCFEAELMVGVVGRVIGWSEAWR